MKKLGSLGIVLLLSFSALALPLVKIQASPVLDTPKEPHVHLGGTQGLNGWYISAVSAFIDCSAFYKIDNGSWMVYTFPFMISGDGRHTLVATDNLYNPNWTEEYHINIDETPPVIYLAECPMFSSKTFTANCSDATSGMNYTEFYLNGKLRETDADYPYEWTYNYDTPPLTLIGIIKKAQFSGYITIPIIIGITKNNRDLIPEAKAYDNAGNNASVTGGFGYCPPYCLMLSKVLVLPNNYTGHLGRFFVHATFYENNTSMERTK